MHTYIYIYIHTYVYIYIYVYSFLSPVNLTPVNHGGFCHFLYPALPQFGPDRAAL